MLELRKRVRPDGAAPFSAPAERGTRTAAGGFALSGRLLSLHRLSGARELPLAGSPLTGGEFFAKPQRGIRRLRTAGTLRRPPRGVAAPAAGAKGRDTCGFLPLELLPFLCFLIRRRLPTCDRCEMWERQSGYSCVCFVKYSQFTDSVLPHIRFTFRRRDITVSRNSLVWRLRTAPTNLSI